MQRYLPAFSRILLAQIFVIALFITVSQISSHPEGYKAYTEYFATHGLPGIFAPISIFVQLVFGLGLMFGYKTKVCAYVLAIYAVFIAIFMKLQEPGGLILTLQYLAIAGGLIMVTLNSEMPCSLDNLKK
jgi:putative oxidoreductase